VDFITPRSKEEAADLLRRSVAEDPKALREDLQRRQERLNAEYAQLEAKRQQPEQRGKADAKPKQPAAS
jgi:hypothetical protein